MKTSSQQAGGTIQQHKTAPSHPPHPPGTPEIKTTQSGAKANLLLDNRANKRPLRHVRVKASFHLSQMSLCPKYAPPPQNPEALKKQRTGSFAFFTNTGLKAAFRRGREQADGVWLGKHFKEKVRNKLLVIDIMDQTRPLTRPQIKRSFPRGHNELIKSVKERKSRSHY